jgi:hypothetical protein
MSNIQRIKDATNSPGAGAWAEEDWDSLIAGELARQAAATGASEAELAWILQGALREYRQTLEAAESALRRWRAADVDANGPVRFGDTFTRVAPKTKREIMDRPGLIAWLAHTAERLGGDQDAADLIDKVWRLDAANMRITSLRGVAERAWRAEHPDSDDEAAKAYARTIIDTFIHEDRDEAGTLEELPLSKAPQYARRLGHGHRVGTFANEPEEPAE